MATPRIQIPAPPVTPAPFGLLSAALVLDDLTGTRGLGIEYQSPACGVTVYDAAGVCAPDPDFGTLSVDVDATGRATITQSGAPVNASYTIDWGDGTFWDGAVADGAEYDAYDEPGDYTVLVSDDRHGYVATVTVAVEDGAPSGPFDADVAFSKHATDGVSWVQGDPAALYHLFQCNPVGMTEADFTEAARAAFRLGEPGAIERLLAHGLARSDDAVDLTVSSPVHPIRALAEGLAYAGARYGGTPVVHASPALVTVLDHYGLIEQVGTRLQTKTGALVVSGGGYDRLYGPRTDVADDATVQVPGDGHAWLYVTGQVVVRRAPVVEVGPVMDRAPGAVNVRAALVERLAVVTSECVAAAALVDLYGGL